MRVYPRLNKSKGDLGNTFMYLGLGSGLPRIKGSLLTLNFKILKSPNVRLKNGYTEVEGKGGPGSPMKG